MSAFAGVFYFDRRPVDSETRDGIEAYLHPFGPDGAGAWGHDGLLLLHRALHVTPEDEQEQPLISPSGSVLTWDGRLDNRDDLLLQFHDELGDCATDAVLTLTALERWGIEGLSRLVGDWSLAFWQAPEHRLWLASDYLGTRPLYYRAAPDHVAWSSSLGELVRREGVREHLDDVFVLGYLANFVPAGYTPYGPVRSVVPAHAMGFGSDGPSVNRRFYDYRINTIRLRTDADYEELLREVFAKAVAVRLRSTQPVWLDLSGGLDSSSVVCMADWLLKRGHVDPVELRSFSFFSGGSPEDDDRRFIAAVEEQCGRRGEHVDEDSTFTLVDEIDGWVTPYHPNGARLWQLRHIRQQRGRVLLTGKGGDLLLAATSDWSHSAVELLQAWRPIGFIKDVHDWAIATKLPAIELLGQQTFALLPLVLRLRLRERRCWRDDRRRWLIDMCNDAVHPSWSDGLAELAEQSAMENAEIERLPYSVRETLATLHRYAIARHGQTPSELPGVCITHPFLDRRLVETTLAIPQSQLNRPGQTRDLMRRAFVDLLPNAVLTRRSKGYASPPLMRVFRRRIEEMRHHMAELELVRGGWLAESKFGDWVSSFRAGQTESLTLMLSALKLEFWLRAHGAHRSAPSAHTVSAAPMIPRRKEVKSHAVREA